MFLAPKSEEEAIAVFYTRLWLWLGFMQPRYRDWTVVSRDPLIKMSMGHSLVVHFYEGIWVSWGLSSSFIS
jgi:hypothetical protein